MPIHNLEKLQSQLTSKRAAQAAGEDAVVASLAADYMPQQEMNRYARNLLELAEVQLNYAITELNLLLDDSRSELLNKAQAAWAEFADEQAAFYASEMEGGTAYPLLYSGEKQRLTVERAAALNVYRASLKVGRY